MVTLFALAVFGFFFYRMTAADERRSMALWLLAAGGHARYACDARLCRCPARAHSLDARDAGAGRGPRRDLFVWMAMAPGPIGSPETLVAWGGSIGPRTTNGEWWRLVTAPFVHTGFLALAANMIGLFQPARLLERLVGPLALVGVYVVAGMFATVVSLPRDPLGVTVGASGAVCGVYGLLLRPPFAACSRARR